MNIGRIVGSVLGLLLVVVLASCGSSSSSTMMNQDCNDPVIDAWSGAYVPTSMTLENTMTGGTCPLNCAGGCASLDIGQADLFVCDELTFLMVLTASGTAAINGSSCSPGTLWGFRATAMPFSTTQYAFTNLPNTSLNAIISRAGTTVTAVIGDNSSPWTLTFDAERVGPPTGL